jgi:CHAD domain-containing protein
MKLSAEQPYGDAAATVIRERTQAVFAHRRKAVLDLGDIEGVHAMRVASRRLRAALEVFEPCLHRKRGARALADVKALARALGERRDRDVGLDLLTGLLATCAPAERRAVEVLIEDLRREQRQANRALGKALDHVRRTRLRRRLSRLAR